MVVFSRRILCWIFQRGVRQTDVIALMRWLDLRYGLKGVIIRNDNGSQFIANKVREALQLLEAKQEFTHVATPEENAYIEAFHSIEQKELIDRHNFESFYDAKKHIDKYMHWYNWKRKHGAIGFITPMKKWETFYSQSLHTFALPGQAEAGNAGEQPDRNNPANEDDWQEKVKTLSCHSNTSLLPIPKKTHNQEQENSLNYLKETVQFIGG